MELFTYVELYQKISYYHKRKNSGYFRKY